MPSLPPVKGENRSVREIIREVFHDIYEIISNELIHRNRSFGGACIVNFFISHPIHVVCLTELSF